MISRNLNRRFFLPASQIEQNFASISDSQVNHIKNVLRLRTGDCIRLFDGTGMEYKAQIIALSANEVNFEIVGKSVLSNESPLHITIAQSYLKEKKMDLLVRQLTEVGVNCWCPFFSERSIPLPDHGKLVLRRHRWEKITMEAVKQCQRNQQMEIGKVLPFHEMLKSASDSDLKILFWENADFPLNHKQFYQEKQKIRSVFSVMGPEGGFSNSEIHLAENEGFFPVRLGPRILRAETATVVACALIQYMFGDFGEKPLDKTGELN